MAETETSPQGIPAATVIIFRNAKDGGAPEILMTVRSRNMVFAGGMAVFPGGRVDQADFDLCTMLSGDIEPEEAAHQIAVVRETLEETGLAIGLQGDIDAFERSAHPGYPRPHSGNQPTSGDHRHPCAGHGRAR